MARPSGLVPGQVLDGRYLIVRELAAGGMSTVFQGTHVKIGRTVAIKVLHPAMASDPDLVARFIKEAKAVGTFGHPNIVASTDFGELPGHIPYLVLEYLDGRTLGNEIKIGGPLPVARALHIASQIAWALAAAHARGVVHRDLTAENVFLTRSGSDPDHVKVLDFGISKFLAPPPVSAGEPSDAMGAAEPGGPDPGPTTQRGLTMGTPEFMAPEQISDPSSVDARVDIYALGVILHYMLAGQTPFGPPFGRLPAHVLLTRVLVAPIPAIERSDIPDGVRALIIKALAKDADQRFSSMQVMADELARFVGLGPATPPPPGARKPRRWIPYGVATLMALLTAAGLLGTRLSGPSPRSSNAPASSRPLSPVAEVPGAGTARPPEPSIPLPTVEPPQPPGLGGARISVPQRRSALKRRGPAEKSAVPAPEVAQVAADDRPPPPRPAPEPVGSQAQPGKPAPAPRAETVDPAPIQAVVRSRLSEIERCYDRGKMDDPELKGRVTVRIHIGPRGNVSADEIESSTLANSIVESCILDAVRAWKFPIPAGGKSAVISYPFNLR